MWKSTFTKIAFIIFFNISVSLSDSKNSLSTYCENDNLVVKIPYSDENLSDLLSLKAGECDETNYNGTSVFYESLSLIEILIPIKSCKLDKNSRYGSPRLKRTKRSLGLYQASATISIGKKFENDLVISMKTIEVVAECGKKTSFDINYKYTGEYDLNPDKIDHETGILSPSYEDDVVLKIEEYTNSSYTEKVVNQTKYVAGDNIFLSMSAENIYDGYKFAVLKCYIIDPNNNEFLLINPSADLNPTCELPGIDFTATYDRLRHKTDFVVRNPSCI